MNKFSSKNNLIEKQLKQLNKKEEKLTARKKSWYYKKLN